MWNVEKTQKRGVTALHCNLFWRIKNIMQTQSILYSDLRTISEPPAVLLKQTCKKGTSWQWYIKWVYLNNLRNICFICYFLYPNLKTEVIFLWLMPPFSAPMSRGERKYELSDVQTQLECDVVTHLWEKWVKLQVIPATAELFYWWTVSLCHIRAIHVATAGLLYDILLYYIYMKKYMCVMTALFSYHRLSTVSLYFFLGCCVLVDLFYRLFMKKCERK